MARLGLREDLSVGKTEPGAIAMPAVAETRSSSVRRDVLAPTIGFPGTAIDFGDGACRWEE